MSVLSQKITYKRKPFFLKGNSNLQFAICFAGVLLLTTAAAMGIICSAFEAFLEQAAFSSHISLTSSGQPFWNSFWGINLKTALGALTVSFLLILAIHIYLEKFFQELAQGLREMGQSHFSFRMKTRRAAGYQKIASEFNAVMAVLEADARKLSTLLNRAVEITRAEEDNLTELKAIQREVDSILSRRGF